MTLWVARLPDDAWVPSPEKITPSPLPAMMLLSISVSCASGLSWMPRSALFQIQLRTIVALYEPATQMPFEVPQSWILSLP